MQQELAALTDSAGGRAAEVEALRAEVAQQAKAAEVATATVTKARADEAEAQKQAQELRGRVGALASAAENEQQRGRVLSALMQAQADGELQVRCAQF